jgi:hypothetical protein
VAKVLIITCNFNYTMLSSKNIGEPLSSNA